MESPMFTPAAPDVSLTFEPGPVKNGPLADDAATKSGGARWSWIGAVSLSGEGVPATAIANGREVRLDTGAKLTFPGGAANEAPQPDGILAIDFNYDFKTDLVLAGAGGVRMWRQDNPGAFTDVTAQTKLPAATVNARYTGAWAVDIEADGDLDVVMGAKAGEPLVLRNNGDGTFTPIHPFAGVTGVREFAWADFNGDGNPDAAIVDGAGKLHVFMNDRGGKFHERALPGDLPHVDAINVADANNDGILDLLAVQVDGNIIRISDKNDGADWSTAVIAQVPEAANNLAGGVKLLVADLDNNGAFDLVIAQASVHDGKTGAGALVWLDDQNGNFSLMPKPLGPPVVFDVADLDGKGRMDMLRLSADGQPLRGANRGARNYHWQTIRPRARQDRKSTRLN